MFPWKLLPAITVALLLSACNTGCTGNVTKHITDASGYTTLTIHQGAGNNYCIIRDTDTRLLGCDIATKYPQCAGK